MDVITATGHTIDEIYYRANHIIHINYHSGDKQNGNFDNITLVVKDNMVTLQTVSAASNSKVENLTMSNLSDFSYGGIYQASLFFDIATYPDGIPNL